VAINRFLYQWINDLESTHHLVSGKRIAELGPQDFCGQSTLARKFLEGFPKSAWSQDFYTQLGCIDYKAFDLLDPRAEACDLNFPPKGSGEFDLITNFGTTEHVLNQASAFKFIHESLKVGGVALCVLPVAGGRDHGFFNYHPNFFWDLARANNYLIIHFEYFPRYVNQAEFLREPIGIDLKLNSRNKKFQVNVREQAIAKAKLKFFFRTEIIWRNFRTLAACIKYPTPILQPFFSEYRGGDYIHIAFKKQQDKSFVFPNQGRYES